MAIGDAYESKRMIPVTRAHAASSGQEGDLYFVELVANGGAHCRVPTTTNPVYDIPYFHGEFENIPTGEADVAKRVMEAYKRVGAILSWSCIPYLSENIPLCGETVAFSESSATPYVNSIIGARTNREAAQSALASGIIGKTPEYGLHFTENRKGSVLVKVSMSLKNEFDYSLLGYWVGKQIGYGIPVLTGISKRPTTEEFINFCAMSNVSGAISMFHVPGFTVEARTVKEAFQGDKPDDRIQVTEHELKLAYEELQSTSGKVEFIMLGCPHYTLKQLSDLADLLKGKRVRRNVPFWVCTSATTKLLAQKTGFLDAIEKSGAHVVVDTCIDEPCWIGFKEKSGMTDSPKCAYYRRFKDVRVQSLRECVEEATERK